MTIGERPRSLLAFALILMFLYWRSEDRHRVSRRIVVAGILLQLIMGYLLVDPRSLGSLTKPVDFITKFSRTGTDFLLGDFLAAHPAFFKTFLGQVAPMIIWLSALISVLIHCKILPRAIDASGRVFHWIFGPGLSGRTACVAVAAPFLGQTVAPLCIRSSLPNLTRSELMTIMTCGFASMSAVMIGVYGAMLKNAIERASGRDALAYLVASSLMSIPAAILTSKILVPEEAGAHDFKVTDAALESRDSNNLLSALAMGAAEGVRLVVGIAATVLAFTSLLALCGTLTGQWWAKSEVPWGLSIAAILQLPFEMIAWLLGVSERDVPSTADLLRKQIISTEYVAFESLRENLESSESPASPSLRSTIITLFALASFANLPSIAIQMSFLSTVAPKRRNDIAELAPKAMLAGTLASWMTASVIGLWLREAPRVASRPSNVTAMISTADGRIPFPHPSRLLKSAPGGPTLA